MAPGESTAPPGAAARRGAARWAASRWPATPERFAHYATRRADQGVAVSTLRVDLAAIRAAHRLAGVPLDLRDSQLVMVVESIPGGMASAPLGRAAVPDVLRQLLAACGPATATRGARDRAMLRLSFGAALRRSELVALRLGDVARAPGRSVRVLVRRSKTDQQGQGQEIAVWANPAKPALCPMAALEGWRAHRDQASDLDWSAAESARRDRPLLCAVTKAGRATGVKLSDKAVARLVKGAAMRAGLDPERYSGHSLRAGLATAAGDAGAVLPDLMRQARYKSARVALAYLRPADLWRDNVTEPVFAIKEDGPNCVSHAPVKGAIEERFHILLNACGLSRMNQETRHSELACGVHDC